MTYLTASEMARKLTLKEIAAHYGKSPRAFRDLVKREGIPHFKIGREMRFALSEVDAFLRPPAVVKDNVVKFTPKRRAKGRSKLAEAVGV
jgi:excisionase family DNA binding protein